MSYEFTENNREVDNGCCTRHDILCKQIQSIINYTISLIEFLINPKEENK